jgi:hypothetical protein
MGYKARLRRTREHQGIEIVGTFKKELSMDISQVTNISLSDSSVQGVQGHHHRHKKSINDMISDMESAIDDATKSGKLTSDQATSMTTILDSIKKTLSQATGSSKISGDDWISTSNSTQLSSADQQKIRKELHDVGKQLFQALNPHSSATSAKQSSGFDAIFKALDSNKDGSVNKDELTSFLSSLTGSGSNASNAGSLVSSSFTYSEQATYSITQTRSSFSALG